MRLLRQTHSVHITYCTQTSVRDASCCFKISDLALSDISPVKPRFGATASLLQRRTAPDWPTPQIVIMQKGVQFQGLHPWCPSTRNRQCRQGLGPRRKIGPRGGCMDAHYLSFISDFLISQQTATQRNAKRIQGSGVSLYAPSRPK